MKTSDGKRLTLLLFLMLGSVALPRFLRGMLPAPHGGATSHPAETSQRYEIQTAPQIADNDS